MKKLLIILNGECENFNFLHSLAESFDSVFCADGGYNLAVKAGVIPDAVIGDFDSADIPVGVEVLKFPVEKDETDTEIAINEGKKRGYHQITLTCTLGGRCDHMITNILMISRFDDVKIEESECNIEVLKKEKILNFMRGKTVSFIPLEKAHIKLEGFKYPLNGEVNVGTTLTMSNIVTCDVAKIKIKYGKIIMVITK